MESGSEILHQQAVRVPLPDVEAERATYQNIARLATAAERKCALLDNQNVPLTEVYEAVLDKTQESFEHRLQQVAGENYYAVATAYLDGERDDWIGALAAYYMECYYRLQELYTVDEEIFVFIFLRYPRCFTANLSFYTGDMCPEAIRYESATHVEADLSNSAQEQLYADCQYSQHKAAEYIRSKIDCIRDAFPDPDTTPFEQRKYGGFMHVTGRNGATFMEKLDAVSPNPDRFADTATEPGLVPEGPEAKRITENVLDDATVVL